VGQETTLMKHADEPTVAIGGRLKDLEHFTGAPGARPQSGADVIPIHRATGARVPVPRRSRVFLRGGGGHGTFAELTLTAPHPRPATD
jgi:hypothetical protein